MKITLSKKQKQRSNVLEWWNQNKTYFPYLYKAAQAYLHIPATSVPAERIFSIAGYIVRKRRSKLLPTNVNKLVFLHQNKSCIPSEPKVYTTQGN